MKGLGRLFGRGGNAGGPRLPDNYLLYAIGDIHGRDDLLADLLAKIELDSRARPAAFRVLVFLGDLVDRGPSSAEVVERLRRYRPPRTRLVFLTGNHEEVLLRILAGEGALVGDWLRFGGAECLQSYGVDPARVRKMSRAQAVDTIRSAIPRAHAEFLRAFDDSFRAGDYLFVHAGIRPGVPLADQAVSDLRWIREPFLADRGNHGFVVVHGHSICEQVEDTGSRIGLDTGAYRSGILTAIGLQGRQRWYLQAAAGTDNSSTPSGNSATTSALDAVSSQSG